jgi:hypothetical protein
LSYIAGPGFVYNGEDLRVSKTDSAGICSPITDGTSPASAVLKDARAVYTPGLSERTTGVSSAWKFCRGVRHATSSRTETDALGSTRGVRNRGPWGFFSPFASKNPGINN